MQAIFNFDVVATELGPVAVVFKQDDISRLRPVALLIHGFLSDANDMLHWQDVLCADHEVVFVELPGHGRCPPQGDCSVAALTQRLRLVIRGLFPGRPIIAVGASLGGVIALALANGEVPEIRGVIAGDPPLTTAKQWPVQIALHRYLQQRSSNYLTEFAGAVFGFTDCTWAGGRVYYDLLAKAAVPTLILTGDAPLWPVRELPRPARSPQDMPCLIDAADASVIGMLANPHVVLQRIENCGHLVLGREAAPSVPLVRDFCRQRCASQAA